MQAAQAKQAANDFRQLFKSDVGHLITVNVDSFRIETVKAKPAPQQPAKRSPEVLRFPALVVPEKKRRFKPAGVKPKDMSLHYGVASKPEKPTLLRRKRQINLHKPYDFIETFMSVLVKRPVEEAVPNPAVADPLDEIMVDPVTKLKITRRQWEAMGKTSKSAEVSRPSDANYTYDPERKPVVTEQTKTVTFQPLPDNAENKNSQTRKKAVKSVRRLSFKWKSINI